MRYEQFDEAHHNILSVQDVYLGSPAHEAELQPVKDFILGTKEMTFTDLQSFAKYIQVNEGQEVELQVYNVDTETVKQSKITPKNWDGAGLIGADISFGYFNRLPLRKKDQENLEKRNKMQNIFGKLSNNSQKQERVESDSGEEESPKQAPTANA